MSKHSRTRSYFLPKLRIFRFQGDHEICPYHAVVHYLWVSILDKCRTLWSEPLWAVCLHVIRHCMHVSVIGEKVGDTGSNMSSNRISCLSIALYNTCLLTCRSAHIVAEVCWLSGLWPSCDQCKLCHESWGTMCTFLVVAEYQRVRPLHMQNWSSLNYLDVMALTELMTHCKIKAVHELEWGGHLFTKWCMILRYIDK